MIIDDIKVAVVDIGSNSIRMNIYNIDPNKNITVIDRKRNIIGLIGYVSNNKMTPDGEGKLFTILREYLVIANQYPVDKFCVFATASMRNLTNSDDVIERIRESLGVTIEILDGMLEAKYDNVAIINRFKDTLKYPFYVLDIGGGSTEINFNYKDRAEYHSIEIGSLALSKRFAKDPMNIKPDEYQKISEYIDRVISENIIPANDIKYMYVIGGTTRSAARMCVGERGKRIKKTDGKKFSNNELFSISKELYENPQRAQYLVKKYCPDRESSVLAGIFAFAHIVKCLHPKYIISCGNGVREGYLDTQIERHIKI